MSAPSGHSPTSDQPRLLLHGGRWAALIPAVVLIAVMCVLSIAERAAISAFWVGGLVALVVGMALAVNRTAYAQTVVRGLTDRTGAVVILAFIFAGVFGTIMKAAGLVDGLLWVGLQTGLTGAAFTVLAFLLACVFAAGTGTSVGTVLAMVPVLYPAGVALGADPTMLAVALIAGGAFGDNIAPISDTTVTSAFTQDAEMGDVVRSRLPLALTAAAVAVVVFALTGGGGEVTATDTGELSALGLIQLIPFALVLILAVLRRHIFVALTWGIVAAVLIGAVTGQLSLGEVFSIPAERGESTGLLEDGIGGVTGVVMLVLFIMALGRVLAESGMMDAVLERLERSAARGVRSAELTIIVVTLIFTVPLGANAPAILLVGPTIAKPLGSQYSLSPARRANLLDCSACTVFYMLPWHNAVIVWFATVSTVAAEAGIEGPGIGAAFLNPYAWAMLVVIVVSAITGWNRSYSKVESAEPVAP
ncbi:Na+/H+ antiporter NhaC family protein [Ruania alba]|uniref:Na+/H+ antiporter NhaC n=1 Tax=Ruania alba TaxID=648782 RepID=A0A1H5LG71_9MICO|nr:Na+/H+ antiporter NhaC family protein [Ruania alba]SEE76055.1 Na+/H+ antiporter NhaC [Ruania alba]